MRDKVGVVDYNATTNRPWACRGSPTSAVQDFTFTKRGATRTAVGSLTKKSPIPNFGPRPLLGTFRTWLSWSAASDADMTATRRCFGEWTTSECRGDQH